MTMEDSCKNILLRLCTGPVEHFFDIQFTHCIHQVQMKVSTCRRFNRLIILCAFISNMKTAELNCFTEDL